MATSAVTPGAPAASKNENAEFLPTDRNYRLTGEMPADKDAEASAASEEIEKKTPSKAEASAASESETAAASEAAPAQEKTRTAAASESRWAKITRENRELRDKLKALDARQAAVSRETSPESQPAPAATPAAEAGKTRPEPKIDDVDPNTKKPLYKTWDEYNRALRAWDRQEALREFQETQQKSARQSAESQQQEAIGKKMAESFAPARAKHADFDSVALNPDLVIPMGSVTDLFIQDSAHAGEVAYYLGQHPELLTGFYGDFDLKTGRFVNKITPQQQFRKLMEIEATFSGDKGASVTPARPVTAAPRPPNQTSGKGTVAKDAVEAAVAAGDTETYMREQNARILARRKK